MDQRDVVHAHGADTVAFLQGQLSQDVAALAVGASAWSLLLEPDGKVVAWLRATRVGDQELVLDTDPGAGAAVVARLARFRLRTDCALDLEEAQPALAVRGVARTAATGGVPILWPGLVGYDLLGPSGTPPTGVELADGARLAAARIDAGVPVSGVDITTETIPAEAGGWLIEASVSFDKGCYTGQELVARVDSRGSNVPRPLRRLRSGSPIAVGAEVTVDGNVVGHVTSAAADAEAGGWVGLGPIARKIAMPADVVIDGHEVAARRVSEHGAGRDDRWQHLAPIHSWMTTATIVLVLVPLMAIGALMYRGRNSATLPHLRPPAGASDVTLPPPTTLPASLAGLPLPAVDGTPTTSTVRLQGNAKPGGAVNGPSGPVPGATVHIERIDGGYGNDIATGQDGRYLVEGVPGGRYRLRAFLAPTYAETESVVAFVAADESHTEDLQVDQYDQLAVTAAVAPDPPVMGSPFNLVIRVAKRTVDSDGVVRSTAIPGAMLVMVAGAVDLNSASATTGVDGTATFFAVCKAAGPLGLSVQVKVTAADAPQTVALDLAACAPLPTTTTTPVTSPTTAATPTTAKPN